MKNTNKNQNKNQNKNISKEDSAMSNKNQNQKQNNIMEVTAMTKLVKATNKTAGVELHIIHEDNTIEVKDVKITKDQIAYELPANPANRRFVNIKNFLALNQDELVLEYKASRQLATNWQSYLTDEEKETITNIEAAAKARMEKALAEKAESQANEAEAKRKAKLEKKEQQIAKLKEALAKLQGNN